MSDSIYYHITSFIIITITLAIRDYSAFLISLNLISFIISVEPVDYLKRRNFIDKALSSIDKVIFSRYTLVIEPLLYNLLNLYLLKITKDLTAIRYRSRLINKLIYIIKLFLLISLLNFRV